MNENPVRKNRMRSSENRRSPDHPSLSVAVPAYNEASVIASTIDRLLTFLRSTGCDFEVIVADDGSTDQTPAIVQSMRLANPELRLTTNGHNMGRGSALRHAFSSAAGSVIAYVDADLPFRLELLQSSIDLVANGSDIAIVSKYAPGAQFEVPFVRKLAGIGYSVLARIILGIPFYDCQGGMKAMKRDVLLAMTPLVRDDRWGWDTEFLTKAWLRGLKVVEIPATGGGLTTRKSTVNLIRDGRRLLIGLFRLRLGSRPRLRTMTVSREAPNT